MTKKMIIFGFVTLASLCSLFSCDGNDIIQPETPSIINNEVVNVSEFVDSRGFEQVNNTYCVTRDDASELSNILRPDQGFTIEPYVVKEDTLLYIVNYEDGWIIIAGDKRINPIVAESDKGSISMQIDNDNLITWIDSYADEINVIRYYGKEEENEYTKLWSRVIANKRKTAPKNRNEVEYKWAVVSYTSMDSETFSLLIPHLVSTKWGQRWFWNTKLPTDTNANKKCPTGCTAVALSQIVYYMHYFLGKPGGLYHDISISNTSISGPTTNIGFSRSNYVSNTTRWDDMSLTIYSSGVDSYVGDLMLDIGNRLGMSYSGTASSANISSAAMSNYNLTYSQSSYNYQTVRNDLLNSKPINVVAAFKNESNEYIGHSWIIDGIAIRTRHYTIIKHFEYTENWMHESEYYDTFDELRRHYHINSEFDIIEEDGGTYTTEYLMMNWGNYGEYDDGYYGTYPSDTWTIDNMEYKYDKTINYNFR